MNKVSFHALAQRDLSESLVIGRCEIGSHEYPICVWRGTANAQDPFYIYLNRSEISFHDSLVFNEHTHLKVWAVWEKAVETNPEFLDGICEFGSSGNVLLDAPLNFLPESPDGMCKLGSSEEALPDAPPNVLHVDAFVANEPEEKQKIVLILKRIAYELLISSSLKEMHVSLTKTSKAGTPAEPDHFEIQSGSFVERSVGWGRAFKLDRVLKEPSLLGW